MKGVIKGSGKKATYWIDGRQVTKKEFDVTFPDKPLGDGSGLIGFKPLHSEVLAVHPDQITEATEDAKKKGVPTEFDREGRPIMTSSRHFRAYAKAYGFYHRGY